MGDMENAKMGREARDVVAAQSPTTGENQVQAAMRRYLGAAAFRSQAKDDKDTQGNDHKGKAGSVT